ncbi:unnamed protein product, partial [Meganyctiphanes norvegica]
MSSNKGKHFELEEFSLNKFLTNILSNTNLQGMLDLMTRWSKEQGGYNENDDTDAATGRDNNVGRTRGRVVHSAAIPLKKSIENSAVRNLFDDQSPSRFFFGIQVKSIRLPKEGGENGRFKGFGYVEFETRNDLVEALNKNEDAMGNRKIRVDIAEGESGPRRGGGFSDRGPREEFEDRSGGVSDWRRAPPPERSERSPPRRGGFEDRDDRRGGGGGFGDRDRGSGGGFGDRDRGSGGG